MYVCAYLREQLHLRKQYLRELLYLKFEYLMMLIHSQRVKCVIFNSFLDGACGNW